MKNRLFNGMLWTFMFLVPLLLFSFSQTSDAAEGLANFSNKAPAEVVNAAKEGLPRVPELVTNTPKGDLTLGEFYLLHSMHPKKLMKATENVSATIESIGMWQAMVLLDGQPYLMMTIDKMNGEWKAVAYGASKFAKELAQVRKAWPAKEGYQIREVRLYQARADVIQVIDRKGKEVGFVPLTSARTAYGLEKNSFDPAAVFSSAKVLSSSQKALTEMNSQK